MARLPRSPVSIVDASGAPAFGTYEGSPSDVQLEALRGVHQPRALQRFRMHKKWLYGFVATHEVAALFAVVDVNYSSNAFTMVVDLAGKRVVADESALGLPRPLVLVNDAPGAGLAVRFRQPGARFTASRPDVASPLSVSVSVGPPLPLATPRVDFEFSLDPAHAPPPLTVVAPVDGGIVNVTQKWAGVEARGHITAGGRRFPLEGAVGGVDSTYGYLARATSWRWAFACGRLADGSPVGLNLVEGFNETRDDVNENAMWLRGGVHPLGRARFTWQKDDVLAPWHVTTTDGAVDLHFTPIAAHRESRDLKLVVSRFVQPVGLWEGTVKVAGEVVRFDGVPGVTEDQDVVW